MATRFGATPTHAYNNKVKLLVGCLLTLIALLALTFFVISQGQPAEVAPTPVAPVAALPAVDPGTEVVLANSRIEEGTVLEPFMFTTVRMEESKIPLGALRQKDLGARVFGRFAAKLISPQVPVLEDDVSLKPPPSAIPIPAGYRAVAVNVTEDNSAGGFIMPNTRVDVLWRYVQNGETKVGTIVRFVKVLAVDGMTNSEQKSGDAKPGPKSVTLLVLEVDAKKIELARNLGTISLTLVGEQEDAARKTGAEVVGIREILGTGASEAEKPQKVVKLGTMIDKDPKTGRTVTYYLNENKEWVIDSAAAQ